MQVRVLGPVTVVADDGHEPTITSGRLRALLAALALNPGRPLTAGQLIDLLWDEDPPPSARTTLQGYVHRLRTASGPVVQTCPSGYQLADGVGVDLQRLEELTGAAADLLDEDPRQAMTLAEAAVALRRGRPLADLEGNYRFVISAAARLEDQWVRAQEILAEARLRLGEPARAADGLSRVLDDHPYRERLWALLMRALYNDGRAPDALQAFQRARRILVEDLGLDPSPILVDTEHAILTNALSTGAPARAQLSAGFAGISYTRDHSVQLAWRVVGEGPAVILVSGTVSFLIAVAEGWITQLSQRLTVLAFDPRGIGRSDPIIGPCTLDDRVADLAAVMRAAGIDRATLVAINDGGPIALAAAARLPRAVSGVVMLNTVDHQPFLAESEDFERNQRHYEATWGTGCTLWALDPVLASQPEIRRAVIEAEILIASPSQALAANLAAVGADGRPFIPSVRCPVRVLHTARNPAYPIEEARRMAQRLGAEVVELPGNSHNFLFDDPTPSVTAIGDFVAGLDETSG